MAEGRGALVGPDWIAPPPPPATNAVGIYILYQNTPAGIRAVKIGEGQILARLRCHRRDDEIMDEDHSGTLLLAWAEVPKGPALLMIERYLTAVYRPKREAYTWSQACL